jgi:hypothetical protein
MNVPAMLPPSRFVDIPRGEDPMPEREEAVARPPATLLPWAIKLSLAVGIVALAATQYLSRAVETGPRQREARAGQFEPETTGSIGQAAGRTLLDPCTAAGLRR